MPETKSTQSEFVRVGKVETQAGNPGSRSENWLSMREGSESHTLGRLTKIPGEQLTEDDPSYRVTVAVPGESKTNRALLLRGGKNYSKPVPNSGIDIQRSPPNVHFV